MLSLFFFPCNKLSEDKYTKNLKPKPSLVLQACDLSFVGG